MNFHIECDILMQQMRRKEMTCEQCQRHLNRLVQEMKDGVRKVKLHKIKEVRLVRNLVRYSQFYCSGHLETGEARSEIKKRDDRERKIRDQRKALVIGCVAVEE